MTHPNKIYPKLDLDTMETKFKSTKNSFQILANILKKILLHGNISSIFNILSKLFQKIIIENKSWKYNQENDIFLVR